MFFPPLSLFSAITVQRVLGANSLRTRHLRGPTTTRTSSHGQVTYYYLVTRQPRSPPSYSIWWNARAALQMSRLAAKYDYSNLTGNERILHSIPGTFQRIRIDRYSLSSLPYHRLARHISIVLLMTWNDAAEYSKREIGQCSFSFKMPRMNWLF